MKKQWRTESSRFGKVVRITDAHHAYLLANKPNKRSTAGYLEYIIDLHMNNKEQTSIILRATDELNRELSDPSAVKALVTTIFKDFTPELAKQACLEAMIRGYSFSDIVKKKIYAIKFGSGYTLVQSIADVRSVAMKSGHVGTNEPIYKEDEKGRIISCSVTVKRKIGDYIGDYTATVYFVEYDKKKDNWVTKPRTMISKVAEMHALRKAFPEELSETYIEEEFEGPQAAPSFNERLKNATTEGMTMSSRTTQPVAAETAPETVIEAEMVETPVQSPQDALASAGINAEVVQECHGCAQPIREDERQYSLKKYGKQLCRACQKTA